MRVYCDYSPIKYLALSSADCTLSNLTKTIYGWLIQLYKTHVIPYLPCEISQPWKLDMPLSDTLYRSLKTYTLYLTDDFILS